MKTRKKINTMKISTTILKIMALSMKEARDILQNKIYILVVFVQIFIIMGAVGLVAVAAVASDPALMDQVGITSALNVGLPEDLKGSTLAQYFEDEKLTLNYYKTTEEAQKLLGNKLVAVVDVSPSGEVVAQMDYSNAFYPVASTKINNAVEKFNIEKRLKNAGLNQSQVNIIQNPVNLQIIKINQDNEAKILLDSSYFVELIYGFIIPFILLLPFFLASNIVTDSVVGEKERKTFEVLLMTPMSSYMIIIGKTLPILLFSLIQSLLWMGFLDILRVPIYNPVLLFLVLFFIGLGFIGVGIFISMLVDSTKEANSAITLVLVFATFILFIPLFIKSDIFQGVFNFIPTVLMVKLASSPTIKPEIMLYLLPTLVVSFLIFIGTVRSFKHERAIRL
ncbi:ABC transporter permease [Methanobacterium petrolearium]|uniref:ABC transporter permease n=1 Tax=Methanobacterium petrolearium TaxID=710190 RepID=UPI001FD73930|nr:ABC transporter permease [Methanobacterium petrolearium]MBP1944760.1 ABC-2 type transport system permease protein [Methanobacterium petrolearium]BDZ70034.1 ABC transporter [Methanobacterium petrolearium]